MICLAERSMAECSEISGDIRMIRRRIMSSENRWNAVRGGQATNFAASIFCAFLIALRVASCSTAPSAPDAALNSLSADRLLANIKTLSSDQFEGRAPGSNGETLTIKYMEDQFRANGLEPGNPDGTFLQNVPLVSITPQAPVKIALTGHGQTLSPTFPSDF